MKKMVAGAVGAGVIGLVGLIGCGTSPANNAGAAASTTQTARGAPTAASVKSTPGATTPAPTKTVTVQATPSTTPTATATVTQAAPPVAPAAAPATPQPADQNVTDPWAVVSAYYGDIESGNYAQAYALLGSGMTTGQSYQSFAAGFACTGSQAVSENGESGDQVNFDLVATNDCNGTTQTYTGTDTVQNGVIVSADVVQTS
jgi:hypothetical protein